MKHLLVVSLEALEEALPYVPGDGSEAEKRFRRLRARMMNVHGANERELVSVLQDFAVKQVFEREVVKRIEIPGEGEFNLPPNVKMPSEKRPDTATGD